MKGYWRRCQWQPVKVLRMGGFIAALVGALGMAGCTNPVTPAGYVGYVTRVPLFAGRAHFYGLQTGPTSTGLAWRLYTTNVSITPFTTTESFYGHDAVLSKDNLDLQFAVNLIWRIDEQKVQQFVEKYATLTPGQPMTFQQDANEIVSRAYGNYLRQPLRTYARDEIQQLDALDVKDQITPIGERIARRLRQFTSGTPFVVEDVEVGTIMYPASVATSVAQMMAATQQLKRTEIEAQTRVAEAQGIAKAMQIINQSLSPAYVQYEAIKAQELMAGAPNHTVIYIPVGDMGIPLVGTFDATASKLSNRSASAASSGATR